MDIPKIEITPEILASIAELDEFKGEWRYLTGLSKDKLVTLKKVASIESIGSSTRIEGSKLTDGEIESLLKGLDLSSFRSRDEEEVAGYSDAMNQVFDSYHDIPLTENYIKQFHKILLKYSSKDRSHKGNYKKIDNHLEAFDSKGKSLGVVLKTVSPFETPIRMKSLIDWTSMEIADKKVHPLIVISLFTLNFLAIHPFQDGNGRLSRILTTLLLLKAGYTYVPYSSLEKIIEENKDNYYLSLNKAQKNLRDFKKINIWIVFFLDCLVKQKNALRKKINAELNLVKSDISSLSQMIISLIKDHGKLAIGEIVSLTNANRNTVKANLKVLATKGYIQKFGNGKGSYYTI
ncbi:MAG: Fic family protein [Leptospiraceae bacterium]|nr:Fic family protein [Leptospiraceae bacterium]